MIKSHYLQELNIQSRYIKKGDKGDDVKKVQEWIKIWSLISFDFDAAIAVDGDFGPGTLRAVKLFQKYRGLTTDGIVGNITWRSLTERMKQAFTLIDKSNLSDLIIAYANAHVAAEAREIKQNKGPWVRAYADGKDGKDYPWCMGFVMTVLDQAYSTIGDLFINHVRYTLGCDQLAEFAIQRGLLLLKDEITSAETQIKPGDIFLKYVIREKNGEEYKDWTHTGFVERVDGNNIHTIEGNTNDEGSREGYEACKRKRNLETEKIDIFNLMD